MSKIRGKMKTAWNLTLLYKGPDDPAIERDMRAIETAAAAFEKKYAGKAFTASPELLARAMGEYDALMELFGEPSPWWYFALMNKTDAGNALVSAKMAAFEERFAKARNRAAFFALEIGKIPKKDQKRFLSSRALAPYAYFLEKIFAEAKHMLSLKEEQLANLLSQTSYSMWVDGQEKLLSGQTIQWNGKATPLPEVQGVLAELPDAKRQEAQAKLNEAFKSISHFAEAEINAVYSYKKTMDELRGFEQPYEATLLAYETDKKTVEALVRAVTESFGVSRKFYSLHAKLLGKKKITFADRGAMIGTVSKKFPFEDAVDIVRSTLSGIDARYGAILDSYLANGQIDAFPKKGKRGGAFCWSMGLKPVFVFLNHADTIGSVETLAHEMGHAIHSELSKSQPALYRDYPMSAAEVASTFFEQAATDALEKDLSDKDQITLLHNRIMGDIATIFRQIACFNFELELHETVRREGMVSKERIAAMLVKHLKSHMGPVMDFADDDGYYFVYWSHIRSFFYVYSYAYGQLISKAMYARYKADRSYAGKVAEFLSSGSSRSPKDIFKSIGIDTADPSFWKDGIKAIEDDIKKLERLAKKAGMLRTHPKPSQPD